MRKLMLASRLTPELTKELVKLLPAKPSEMKLAFISTAADPYEDKGFVLKDKAALESVGFAEMIDIDLKQPEDLAKLDECGAVFMSGGNTFYLLKWIRQSAFDQKIKEFLSNDKMYIGSSAGSIVMGTSIEVASATPHGDHNEVGLEDPRGLRHVPFMISPHFQPGEKFALDRFAKKAALRPIIALTDDQAIVCEGDRYRVVGKGDVMTWNSKLFR